MRSRVKREGKGKREKMRVPKEKRNKKERKK